MLEFGGVPFQLAYERSDNCIESFYLKILTMYFYWAYYCNEEISLLNLVYTSQ